MLNPIGEQFEAEGVYAHQDSLDEAQEKQLNTSQYSPTNPCHICETEQQDSIANYIKCYEEVQPYEFAYLALILFNLPSPVSFSAWGLTGNGPGY